MLRCAVVMLCARAVAYCASLWIEVSRQMILHEDCLVAGSGK